jgi:hypothetical protein
MTDDKKILSKKEYKTVINYESILAGHLNRLATYRDSDPKQYCSSIETYMLICPPDIADVCIGELSGKGLVRGEYENITTARLVLYDDLLRFVNRKLNEEGLIFKKSTYEIGLED